jgi:hypothetical protein
MTVALIPFIPLRIHIRNTASPLSFVDIDVHSSSISTVGARRFVFSSVRASEAIPLKKFDWSESYSKY